MTVFFFFLSCSGDYFWFKPQSRSYWVNNGLSSFVNAFTSSDIIRCSRDGEISGECLWWSTRYLGGFLEAGKGIECSVAESIKDPNTTFCLAGLHPMLQELVGHDDADLSTKIFWTLSSILAAQMLSLRIIQSGTGYAGKKCEQIIYNKRNIL